ncbi:glycoside hydrolase [Gymnopus androsaceus JB14]|uniref:Glycoside hydrolase n=1 Tax=Gymnopus androsaceus JB14 TaxID=1447944 RepID=A0A6A4GHF7_9AGAR|nr:glycoside hydrolase [Gymnopus androsaceus JB14]
MSDILAINSALKIHLLPWSPPRWMKTGDAMNGGSLSTDMVQYYATYLFKAVEAWDAKGFPVYAVSIQNEVLNSNPTYPTALFTPAVEGQVGTMLRTLLNSSSLSAVKIIGYEHNWNDATTYPVELMEAAESAFDGVAFHCYGGTVDEQSDFYALYPSKEIYFTECSGTPGTDWWMDIKYSMDTLWIGGLANWARTGLMWNIAEDEAALPLLPTANDCVDGCRGIVTINTNGTYVLNQEFYGLAQASKAIIPKDIGGPFGQRIENTVEGSANWALIVGSYMTGRVSSTSNRYSLVVLNWDDSSATGTVTPVSVPTTIEFRGVCASYTFPVGVTTLTWYAEAE